MKRILLILGLVLPVTQVELLAADKPGALPQLKVSDNRRFLVAVDGQPFFWLGDTAWELFHRLNREEAERYLKRRANPAEIEYYLCGPPAMVQATTRMLEAMNVPKNQIAFDEF